MKLAKRSCEGGKDSLIPTIDKYTELVASIDRPKIQSHLKDDLQYWENKLDDHQKKKNTIADKIQAILAEQ